MIDAVMKMVVMIIDHYDDYTENDDDDCKYYEDIDCKQWKCHRIVGNAGFLWYEVFARASCALGSLCFPSVKRRNISMVLWFVATRMVFKG